jgi:hypothetical protein
MSSTTTMENLNLDAWFGGVALSVPGIYYAALSTTTPTEAGTNFTEPASGAYARVAVTNNLTNFPSASGGSKTNGTAISFTESTASWGTITHIGFYNQLTGGTLYFWEALPVSKAVAANVTVYFSAGALTISNLNAG